MNIKNSKNKYPDYIMIGNKRYMTMQQVSKLVCVNIRAVTYWMNKMGLPYLESTGDNRRLILIEWKELKQFLKLREDMRYKIMQGIEDEEREIDETKRA